MHLAAISDVSITNRVRAYSAEAFITQFHYARSTHGLYARHIQSRGVATDRSPVTTRRVVAYALCSKNVVRVNEAKPLYGGFVHQGHSVSYVALLPPSPPPSTIILTPLTVDHFKLFAGSDSHFSTYLRTHEESLKSANNLKIGV